MLKQIYIFNPEHELCIANGDENFVPPRSAMGFVKENIEMFGGAGSIGGGMMGMGVSKLTHENAVQMSLFEDPKMDFYREWDRKYDEEKSQNEDAKTLAYERMKQQ